MQIEIDGKLFIPLTNQIIEKNLNKPLDTYSVSLKRGKEIVISKKNSQYYVGNIWVGEATNDSKENTQTDSLVSIESIK